MKVTHLVVAAGVGAVLVVGSGCSVHPGTAAVVEGRTISQDYLDDTYAEVEALGLDKSTTLALIIAAPYFIEAAAENGVGVTAGEARSLLEEGFAAQGTEPTFSDGTVEFVRLRMALQNLQALPNGDELIAEVDAEVLALEMDINPRYGAMDRATGQITRGEVPWIVGG